VTPSARLSRLLAGNRPSAPLEAAALACVLLVLAPPAPVPLRELTWALALTAAIGVAIAVLGRRRSRVSWVEALPPLAFLVVVALVRDAQGGAGAGFAALALLPVLWLALHGTRAQLLAGVAGGAATLLLPIALVGAPAYPLASWRPGVQWLVVATLVGLTVQRLASDARMQAGTVSRQAEALRAGERRTRSVLDNLTEVVFQTDPAGRLRFLNEAWLVVTGFAPDEALGRFLQEFVHPEDRVRNGAGFVSLVERQASFLRHVIRIATWDGEPRWVEVRAQLTLDASGRLLGISGTLTDVTERREAQELAERRRLELEEANRDLAARNRDVEAFAAVQRDFVATSSHELRTPLTSILGFLEMVLESEPEHIPEPERSHLGVAYRSSQRLLALVEDLLTVNRVDTGHLSIVPAPTGVPALLAAAHETFAHQCAAKGVALVLEDSEPLYVLVDPARMEQVLGNLVGNAVKFTPAGGTIRLTARADGERVLVHVADTGPGIGPEDLPRVFERFFRTASAQVGAVPGTGLGLPIAKALAEAQGGELSVASVPGAGTTFTISLPLAQEAPWLASSSSTTIPTS